MINGTGTSALTSTGTLSSESSLSWLTSVKVFLDRIHRRKTRVMIYARITRLRQSATAWQARHGGQATNHARCIFALKRRSARDLKRTNQRNRLASIALVG